MVWREKKALYSHMLRLKGRLPFLCYLLDFYALDRLAEIHTGVTGRNLFFVIHTYTIFGKSFLLRGCLFSFFFPPRSSNLHFDGV